MNATPGFFESFMPHGMCYIWKPEILWLNVISDAAIAIAYFSIPFALFYYLKRRPDMPFRGVVIMFSVFIFACGMTHSMGIWIVWNGDYGIQGILKAVTAMASIATAAMLYPYMPRIMSLRSPQELERANTALQDEIDERKIAESRSNALMESSPDGTLVVDGEGCIVVLNALTLSMFGYSRDELIGQAIEILIPSRFQLQHAQHRTQYMSDPRRRAMGVGLELMGRRKDGTEFPVEVTLNSVGTNENPLVSAAIRDISDRVELERKTQQLRQEVAHMGRLTTMGEMATGIAHELNQPLTAIVQNTDAARLTADKNGQLDPALQELLHDIELEAQRAGEIIRAMRQYISKDVSTQSEFDLNELIFQTVALVTTEARSSNIEIETLSHGSLRVTAHRVQIAQVLLNLLRNSIDAIVASESKLRKITINAQQVGGKLVLSVQDTGPGLEFDLSKIKAFESSKPDGMGIGLSISRSLIEAHGGELWSDPEANTSAVGRGAQVSFSLPLPA